MENNGTAWDGGTGCGNEDGVIAVVFKCGANVPTVLATIRPSCGALFGVFVGNDFGA